MEICEDLIARPARSAIINFHPGRRESWRLNLPRDYRESRDVRCSPMDRVLRGSRHRRRMDAKSVAIAGSLH